MKRKTTATILVAATLPVLAGAAWFGEYASIQERTEMELRSSFISIAYYLLYGTVYGNPEGSGTLSVYQQLKSLILMTPPLDYYIIHNIIGYFIMILQPAYVTAILATSGYMIFFSASPSGRKKAKELLPRLGISMVIVTLSFPILRLIFLICTTFSKDLIDKSGTPTHALYTETLGDLVRMFSASAAMSYDAGYALLTTIFVIGIGTVTLLAARYIILLAFTLTFPLAVFLYTFNTSRSTGRFMIEQLLLWNFVSAFITVALVTSNLGIYFLAPTGDLRTLAGLTAVGFVFASPIMLLIMIRRFLP